MHSLSQSNRPIGTYDSYVTQFLRYSVALILLWYGIFKFTPTEAEAIVDLIENSPFMSWLYLVGSVQGVSILIGVIEILAALGMVLHRVSPRIAVWGDLLAVITFLATLSFLATTPGMFRVIDGVPVPAGGGFILKDLVLLGAALHALIRDYRHWKQAAHTDHSIDSV